MRIEDGKGKNGDMSVSAAQRGNVSSKSAHRSYYVSRDDGQAFNSVFDEITSVSGDYTAYIKNTSVTRNLFIGSIEFHSVENAKWKIWSVSGTAASGELITPTNLNLISGRPSETIAMSGNVSITGLTNIAQLGSHRSQALSESHMDFGGALILGPGDAIAIELDAAVSGLVSHDVFFWFETIGFS